MKVFLLLIVLLALAGLGFHNHRRLSDLHADQKKLVAVAAERGMIFDPSSPKKPVRVTRHPRADGAADARRFFHDLMALGDRLDAPDDATKRQIAEQAERFDALNGEQLKILIHEILSAETDDMETRRRQDLLWRALNRLTVDYPRDALAILTESSAAVDLLRWHASGFAENAVHGAIHRWAEIDPEAAIGWFTENSGMLPDDAARSLIHGAARNDLRRALDLIGELGQDPESFFPYILVKDGQTQAQQIRALAVVREWSAALPDEKTREKIVATSLLRLALGDGWEPTSFHTATRWIDAANLTPEELGWLMRGSWNSSILPEETGQWLDWLGLGFPIEQSADRVRELIHGWMQTDYRAAGEWLVHTPESPARTAALIAYARMMAEYQPLAATEWALMIPPGTDRDEILKRIHHHFPDDDPSAKEAFAEEHGIR